MSVQTAAHRGGVGDPGPLASQEEAWRGDAVNHVALVRHTTGDDGTQPVPHDPTVLAARVSGDPV